MIPQRYDLAFSIGSSCNCTVVLRKAGLQYESLPLDWLWRTDEGQPVSEVFRSHVSLGVGDFTGLLRLENLEYASQEGDHIHSHVIDRGTGVTYYHDFPCNQTIAEAYPTVVEKYHRRFARLQHLLRRSRSALVVWIGDARDNGRITEEDIAYCLKRFAATYPEVRFHMLVIDSPKDFPRDDHRVEHGNGFDRHVLDIRYEGETEVVWRIAEERVLPILAQYAVRDYRTSATRRAYRQRQTAAEMARFHVGNRLSLCWVRLQYRLYRHLLKRLARRGLSVGGCA